MAQPNIRKFRHEIAVLKRRGLVTGVDARSATPTKKLTNIIERFDDVLSGKATPVKLSKSETKNMKDAGYDTFKGRVLFPHSIGEKVGVTHGHAYTKDIRGVEHVTIPIPFHDIEAYVHTKRNQKAIDAMKRKDEYFAFRYYGYKSTRLFHNVDSLIDYLQTPTSGAAFPILNDPTKNAKEMNETYRNLEIVKVHRVHDWKAVPNPHRIHKKRTGTDYQAQKKKRERGPKWKQTVYLATQAEKIKRWRAGLTGAELEAYRAAGRKRARKSRRKHDAKTKTKTSRTRS
jgi:hypothetical protein